MLFHNANLKNANTVTEHSKVTTLKKNHSIRGKDIIIYFLKTLLDHFIITSGFLP